MSLGDPNLSDEQKKQIWSEYFERTVDKPPDPIFQILDPRLPIRGRALDLGCGAGRGTLHLLSKGLEVTAVDISKEALEMLALRLPADARAELVHSAFEDLALSTYDVVVAAFSLFFLPPPQFAVFWQRLTRAIEPGGLFAGHLLGVNDTWAERGYTVFEREQISSLFGGFEVVHQREEDQDGETATGAMKHWHVFHLVARKLTS